MRHELSTLNLDLLVLIEERRAVEEGEENTAGGPAELIAEGVAAALGRGEATTVGQELLDLAALRVDLVNGLDRVEVIDTRVKADLVEDDDSGVLGSLIELAHGGGDVGGSNDVGLALDSGFDDSSVVGVGDEGNNKVVLSNSGLERLGVVDIEGDGSGAREIGGESLSAGESTAGNGEAVLRTADDVLGARAGDEATAEEEDLLRGLSIEGEELPAELGADVDVVFKDGTSELGEDEGSLVHLLVVVLGIFNLANGGTKVTTWRLGSNNEADLTGRIGGDGGESVLGDGEDGGGALTELLDQGEVEPEALSLGGDVAARSEGVMEELEVGLLEEGGGGANRVRGVGNDNIVGGLVVSEELETVADEDGDTGIGEEGGHVGEVLLGDANHGLQNC